MAQEIQGSDIEFLVRVKDTGEFKTMTCEKTVFLDVSNDVTKESTKCGTFKGIQQADFKLNGEAVFNADPETTEVSYNEALGWQLDRTKIEWIMRNRTIGVDDAGTLVRMSGDGYFVNTQFDGSDGVASKFTWGIEGSGTLNDTEST